MSIYFSGYFSMQGWLNGEAIVDLEGGSTNSSAVGEIRGRNPLAHFNLLYPPSRYDKCPDLD